MFLFVTADYEWLRLLSLPPLVDWNYYLISKVLAVAYTGVKLLL